MNVYQAKQLSLPALLAKLGHHPVKDRKEGMELWYKSPFRTEEEPSFVTSYLGGKWIWNDFGDRGGTVIDFVMRHENYSTVKEALAFLDRQFQGNLFSNAQNNKGEEDSQPNLFSFNQQRRAAAENFSESSLLVLKEVKQLQNPVIIRYLTKERAIPITLAQHYLKEVIYHNRNKGKDYFAFGMTNQSGGIEIRAASSSFSFKSALNGRDITLIQSNDKATIHVSLFEGMTDFLSLLALLHTTQLQGDAIILHSLSSISRAVRLIEQKNYRHCYSFLDNDRAGEKGTADLKSVLAEKLCSQSHLFAPHSDLNDALKVGLNLSTEGW